MNKKNVSRKLNSKAGNLTLIVMIGIVLCSVVLVGILQLGANYTKNQFGEIKNANLSAQNQFDLLLASAKFKIIDRNKPVWYPFPYPSEEDLLTGKKPLLEVVQDSKEYAKAMVPIREVVSSPQSHTYNYDLDSTRMGSILKTEDVLALQTAWIAGGKLSNLPIAELEPFLVDPKASWPTQAGNNSQLMGIANSKLTFISYGVDETNPTLVKNILLKIENVNEKKIMLARVAVDAPPVPNCQIQLAPGQASTVESGSSVRFLLKSDSIVGHALLSGDDFKTAQIVKAPQNQSIKNLGVFAAFDKEVIMAVPVSPQPGNAFDGSTRWTVSAKIFGVDNSQGANSCSLDVKVNKALPPDCTLTANPRNPSVGQTTTLSLACKNTVSEAKIDNQIVRYDSANKLATLVYTKTRNETVTVYAEAKGPGGTATPSTVLGIGCRFNDPNYIEYFDTANGSKPISYAPERSFWYETKKVYKQENRNFYMYGSSSVFNSYLGYVACQNNHLCMYGINILLGDGVNGVTYAEFGPKDSEACALTRVYYRMPGTGCFIADTKIKMSDQTEKEISLIREGDLVWNPQLKKSVRVVKVTAGPETIPLWKVQVGERTLRVTEDHPFFKDQVWVRADSLKKGDTIFLGKRKIKITDVSKETSAPLGNVWNFEVEGKNHTIEANGIPTGDLWVQMRMKKHLQ